MSDEPLDLPECSTASARFIGRLARLALLRPWLTLAGAVLLAAAAVGWAAAGNLPLVTKRNALLSEDLEYNRRYLEYTREMEQDDRAIVVVPLAEEGEEGGEDEGAEVPRGATRARAERFIRELADRLRRRPELFPEVVASLDPLEMGPRALLYLPLPSIRRLVESVREDPELVRAAGRARSPGDLVRALEAGLDRRLREGPPGEEGSGDEGGAAPEALRTFLRGIARVAGGEEEVPRPAILPPRHLETPDGRYLIALVTPASSEGAGLDRRITAIRELRAAVDELAERRGVPAGLTGQPVLAVDEMKATTRDTTLATGLAIGVCFVLFAGWYRRLRAPFLATAALVCALAWSFGFAALTVGRLNILSVVFCVILIGLGLDFGIHVLTHVESHRARGASRREAALQAAVEAGPGILGGGLTSAFAFLAMALTDFRGLRELGIIAGGGLVLCLIASFTVLPALVATLGGRRAVSLSATLPGPLLRAAEKLASTPRRVLAAGLLLAVAGAVGGGLGLRYDANLLDLQPAGLESVRLQEELLRSRGPAGMTAAVLCEDETELRALADRLDELETVGRTESILDAYPEREEAKLDLLAGLAPLLEGGEPGDDPDRDDPTGTGLAGALRDLGLRFEDAADEAFRAGRAGATELLVGLADDAREAADAVAGSESREALRAWGDEVVREVRGATGLLRGAVGLEPSRGPDDLPAFFRDRHVGRTGRLLLRVRPARSVWAGPPLTEFCRSVREVAPGATGVPFQIWESSRRMRRGYEMAGLYAVCCIAVFLILHFRGPRGLLALGPLVVGGGWFLGLFVLAGLELNPANIVVLPLVVGTGVDYGIYVLHRWRELPGPVVASETGRAVSLSALTTMTGFGSLMLARHRGIASIGFTVALAVGMAAVAALWVLPSILALLAGERPSPPPGDNSS